MPVYDDACDAQYIHYANENGKGEPATPDNPRETEECLFPMMCPQCGATEKIGVLAVAEFMVDNNIMYHCGQIATDDDSDAWCNGCGLYSKVGAFRTAPGLGGIQHHLEQ